MRSFQKKRVEIRLDVYEDGRIENSITGGAREVAFALTNMLCTYCIKRKVDGISRGELRDAITARVGEIFDDVWRAMVLGGELE